MSKMWFQMKERGAGEKRLFLSFYLYKIFGEKVLRLIAFFVALAVFLTAKERRDASIKFLKLVNKPQITGSFRQFLNFANALVDKILAFAGKIDPDRFLIDDEKNFSGTFFITTHIGNVEILRALLAYPKAPRANVFLQSNACEIFNRFLKKMEIATNLEVFPVEDIGVETSIQISDRIKSGEIVFIAGDRVSAQNTNKTYEAEFLGRKTKFPLGTLKFALMLGCPICFVVCIKDGENFVVHTKKFVSDSKTKTAILEDLKKEYVNFLEEYTLKYPYQFYNFYDFE